MIAFGRSAGCRFAALAAVGLVLAVASGCGSGVKERVIPVKQETPITQVKNLLAGYAAGEPVGSEIIGFPSLRDAVVAEDPEIGGILAEGLTEIEKIFRQPRRVPKAAEAVLARVAAAAAEQAGEQP